MTDLKARITKNSIAYANLSFITKKAAICYSNLMDFSLFLNKNGASNEILDYEEKLSDLLLEQGIDTYLAFILKLTITDEDKNNANILVKAFNPMLKGLSQDEINSLLSNEE